MQDYERAAKTIRRTILMQEKLDQPARARTAARRQIIRAVEDNIHRRADDEEADDLHAELLERLESLELVVELDDDRPAEAIITDIIRDLGLAAIPGLSDPWKRRTPTDIAILHGRAATPTPSSPHLQPSHPPPKPRPPAPSASLDPSAKPTTHASPRR